jgi:glyoxylase-like metal-dependent hydrolase (beta-lactamase superfamily II)
MSDNTPVPTDTVDEFAVLFAGYVPSEVPWELGTSASVASTVSFLRDGDRKIIVDPGFVPGRQSILDPLTELGYEAGDITDIVFSHWHPDHTFNAALFPNAQAHDVWGIYRGDQWVMRWAEGFQVSPGVTLIQTPGHTDQDVTTLAATDQGLVAFTHLWWTDVRPPEASPVDTDAEAFKASRNRLLAMEPALIVPGHAAAFAPSADTPL